MGEDQFLLVEVWVTRRLSLREAQLLLRELGYSWSRVFRRKHYWVFPQGGRGPIHKLVRLKPGVWAVYTKAHKEDDEVRLG